jgi:hypothetical protein
VERQQRRDHCPYPWWLSRKGLAIAQGLGARVVATVNRR